MARASEELLGSRWEEAGIHTEALAPAWMIANPKIKQTKRVRSSVNMLEALPTPEGHMR
jgi:hypothetical protein